MNQRTCEIIKMALIYLQANREDFIDAESDYSGEFRVNRIKCEPPQEHEIVDALNQFSMYL